MKKIYVILSIIFCLSSINIFGAYGADVERGFAPSTEIEITAKAVYLKNLDTGDVIYEKNADMALTPASLTKVMTAIVAMENCNDISSEIVVYPPEVQNYLYDYQKENGSVSLGRLELGEEMPMRDYLYAALLPSANEAAMSIAVHVGGSTEGFAKMMNDRAQELGATNTNFVNPTGLFDENQYTTARDMAVFAEHAMTLPGFKEIVSTYEYTTGPTNKHDKITWTSTIEMQNPELGPTHRLYLDGISGVKTGTLPEVGHNYISTISKDGYNYLLVLIGCETEPEKRGFAETKAIYQWVFSSFRKQTLVTVGEVVGEIPVNHSMKSDFVQLIPNDHFSALLPEDIDLIGSGSKIEKVMEIPESLNAPVEKGQYVGDYVIKISGEEIGRVPLVAKDNVSSSTLLKIAESVKYAGSLFWVKFAIVFLIAIAFVYISLVVLRNHKRKRRNRAYKIKPPKY